MHLNCGHSIVSTNKGTLVIRSECVEKRLKNFHVSKSDFCNFIIFTVITQDDKGALINIESVLRPSYYVACQGVL